MLKISERFIRKRKNTMPRGGEKRFRNNKIEQKKSKGANQVSQTREK